MSEIDQQQYRSRIRIYYDILLAVQHNPEMKVTHLIHDVNMPYERLMSYLARMHRDGLVHITSSEGDGDKYVITKKGTRFVSEFKNVQNWVNAFGLEL